MNPNGHPHSPRRPAAPGQLSDAFGGALPQAQNKIPDPIPWGAFVSCGMRVLDEGKPAVMVLDPQQFADLDEAVSLFRLLLSMHTPKPGPIAWETVPEGVRRHFRCFHQPAESPTTAPQK